MSETLTPVAERDESIRPQDDLYRHINGGWLAANTIPDDQGSYGSFIQLRDEAIEAVRAIAEQAVTAIEAGEATPVQCRIGNLYNSFMDEETVNAAGVDPVVPMLQRIDAAASMPELMRILGELAPAWVPQFFSSGTMQDAGDTSKMRYHFIQGGLGLPDESYYRGAENSALQQGYQQMLATLFTLAELPEPQQAAATVYELETRLAAHHWDNVKMRDAAARYNPRSYSELLQLCPLIADWAAGAGLDEQLLAEVVVWQPDYLEALTQILNADHLDAARLWAQAAVLRSFAPVLSEDFVNAHFEFYGKQLSGVKSLRPRYKRAVDTINSLLGEDVAQCYVAEHFPPTHKAAIDELVAMLIKAYEASIKELPWMGAATRQRALEKLAAFHPMVGYPVRWIDYSSLDFGPDLVANMITGHIFEFHRDVQKIRRGPDPEEWHMTPQTVNAYYSPLENAIVFPAAILQLPFFDPNRDAAANYGAIGAVIGHEIGHGFDDQGSKYDGQGVLCDWWEEADREAFTQRTAALVDQYAALEPEETPGEKVNGELTLGENIGDLGGLGIAFKAYRLHLQQHGEQPSQEKDQLFFASWAECWRQLTRPETMRVRLATDPHSPNEFRCNQIVKNLDAFHEAFGTGPGDQLWLDPAERVTIW